MTSVDNKPLSTVKDQVEQMFNAIHKLETNDKTVAFTYVQKYLNDTKPIKKEVIISNRRTRKNEAETVLENSKNTMDSNRVKHNKRKLKFKTRVQRVKKTVLKCRTCGSQFNTKVLLFKHLESHIGTPISCKQCKTSFNSNASYLCHISLKMCKKTKKSWKTYCCDQCNKIFRYKRHFDRHVEGHKRNNCTYCDARLTRRKQLVNHLMIVHSIKLERTVMFKCEYCEKRYVKRRSLYHHLKQHSDDKIVCMECGKMSATSEEHNTHFSQHDKDRPWKCDKCNDRFSRRQQYLIHIKRHDRYKCISCDETFASKARVLRHKQRGHLVHGLEPQLKCPHCPMAFQRRLTLQIHMKKHTDDKLMYCKYCNKHFRTPYLYFKHCATTVHDVNSPVQQLLVCEICGKLFVKQYLLDQHLQRVHNLSKQVYTCEYCGHRTTNRKNLERHLSLHLEDKKQIICDKCGKAFYNITTLKDHMSYVHSQERDFKCDQCDKAFKRSSELIRHKTSHSELRPHVCKTCGVSYKRSTHLRRHEESRHGTVTKNRLVQRLTKDDNGQLIPVLQPKKLKTKKKAVETPMNQKQIISLLDPQSREMVSFTLPDEIQDCSTVAVSVHNQDIIQAVPYQQAKLLFNTNDSIMVANDYAAQSLNLVGTFDQNFTGFAAHESDGSISNPFVPETVRIENSTTCDILLPENRILNLQSQQSVSDDFSQHSYQYL